MCRLERDSRKQEKLYECKDHKLLVFEQIYNCRDCSNKATNYHNGWFYCQECFIVRYFGI